MRGILLSITLMLTPALVRAEEAAHGEKGGMPQFDFTTFPGQLFWLGITFIALYLVMALLVVPAMSAIFAARAAATTGTLAEAQRLRDDTAAALANYEGQLLAARTNAIDLRQKAEAEMATRRTEEFGGQQTRITTQIRTAEARIATSIAQARAELSKTATDLAQNVVQRLLNKGAA